MVEKKGFSFSDKWNCRFMDVAKLIATWSKDTSTKVGCVIVGPYGEIRSTGYNGFPRGVNESIEERHERPAKYKYTEHAERNSIFNATLFGTSCRDCVMYVTFPPCPDCARGIIQSGIKEVFYLDMPTDKTQKIAGWRDDLQISFDMFNEAGVKYKSLGVNNNSR
ncbi:MAG: dCMP deaminase family protein [Alphaproteobacteria bacterium]|nr:dCMP deaminase family protein [Alphaproteobacteria bacterium]